MIRSKIILQYKYLLFALFCIIYAIIFNNTLISSKYNINDKEITGYIKSYIIDGNKLSMEIKGKENIVATYYFSKLEDLNEFKTNYELGDLIKLSGNIELPSNNTVFNLFNYKEYLKNKNINYVFKIDNIEKIKDNKNIFYFIKNKITLLIDKNINKEYLYAFILGNIKYIKEDAKESYQINGISHLFAVSGMHISLLTLIILKILKKFKFKNIVVILFLLLYMFLTSFSPSILRSGIMYILLYINKRLKLNISTINLMYILLSILIIIDPYIIYKMSFQYSFIISFYLIKFNTLITNSKDKIHASFLISFISFIVSIPISINNFFSINPFSIILNIFFVPIISSIIFPLTLISLILPISNILKIVIDIFEKTSIYLSKINNFTIIIPKMSIILIILYYIVITYILYSFLNKKYKSILILVILIFIHSNINYVNKSLEVTYIDVSQGDSTLISLPYNKGNILIDTGGIINYDKEAWKIKNNSFSLATDKIIPYLKSKGIKKLDYLIVTHGDYDHMGEAVNLVNNFKVEQIVFNCGEFNDLEKELIKVLEKKKIKYYSCIKELNIDNSKLYFLQTKEYDNENDNSNVIYTELNGYKFIFMGDAGVDKEKDILDKYNLSNVDVLKVGHHGSKTSSSKEFIDEINPKYGVISVGKNNRYGHPNKEVLNNLYNSKIYRTDQDGSIMFKIKKDKLQIETCSP